MDRQFSDTSVLLLVATQTGNADLVAEAAAEALDGIGFQVGIVDMWDAFPEMLDDISCLVICTSTWGEGEIPDNAVDFVDDVKALARPLDHLGYGIIGLGDHHYDPHFCAAARIFEALLDNLGARRQISTLEICEGPTEEDLSLARDWACQLGRVLQTP